jgi:hypothetical protein
MIEQIQPFLSPRDTTNISLSISTHKGENTLHIRMGKKEWSVSLDPTKKEKNPTVLHIPLSPLEILESIIN